MKPIGRPKKSPRYLKPYRTPKGEPFDFTERIALALKTPLGIDPPEPQPLTKAELADKHREIRIGALKRLRIDPMGKHENLSLFMAPLLLRVEGEDETGRNQCREWLANVITGKTADEAAILFQGIVALKQELEKTPHKNFCAYLAYHHFIEAVRREPSRRELKKWIQDNSKHYPGIPKSGNSETWDRLWNDCGLEGLKKQSHKTLV